MEAYFWDAPVCVFCGSHCDGLRWMVFRNGNCGGE